MPVARSLVAVSLAALVAAALPTMAPAAEVKGAAPAWQGGVIQRHLTIGLNKSMIIDLPRPARDVLVSNPGIADAIMRTDRRIYVTGGAVGQTNIFVFDKAGQQILNLELEVERDISALQATLTRLIPGSNIHVELINDNIVLSGTVRNAGDARKAVDVAQIFANGGANANQAGGNSANSSTSQAGGGTVSVSGDQSSSQNTTSSVVNMLAIEGEDQIHLRVTVAEVQRSVAKQFGINVTGTGIAGGLTTALVGDNPFAIAAKSLSTSGASVEYEHGPSSIKATLNALEQEGMIKTLAEPTLTAISGEAASFLAGGEFPVPVARDQDGRISVEYKPFGVSLAFTPVVLSEGRISLHVKTEVSELSTEEAFDLGGLTLPSLKVRRADTTVEMPSGGSLVLGGLLQDSIRQSISGFPGLKNLPVLGTMFRSRDFKRAETELVILVTPYLVTPKPASAFTRPDVGLNVSSDAATIFLGRLNRMYGVQGQPAPAGPYHGRYGFIFE